MRKPKIRKRQRRYNAPKLFLMSLLILKLLTRISDTLTIKLAYWVWFSSPKFSQPQREISWGESANFETIQHEHGPIAIYSWGTGPCILLSHGWSGRGLQLASLAKPLVDAGFRVVAFDAPGHGLSKGSRTNIFKYQQVLNHIANLVGPVHGVIAHSFGVLVSALAIKKKLELNKLVCISSPTSAEYLLQSYCEKFQFSKKVEQGLLACFKEEFGESLWRDISAIENLKNVKKPILIIHDKNDRDVPIKCSEQLHHALEKSVFMQTEKLGHRRILRDPQVIEKTTAFMLEDK